MRCLKAHTPLYYSAASSTSSENSLSAIFCSFLNTCSASSAISPSGLPTIFFCCLLNVFQAQPMHSIPAAFCTDKYSVFILLVPIGAVNYFEKHKGFSFPNIKGHKTTLHRWECFAGFYSIVKLI